MCARRAPGGYDASSPPSPLSPLWTRVCWVCLARAHIAINRLLHRPAPPLPLHADGFLMLDHVHKQSDAATNLCRQWIHDVIDGDDVVALLAS